MSGRISLSKFLVVVSVALLVSGCGQSAPLVPVTGTVTLDGAPLPNAQVQFRPLTGRPSVGVTDSDGKYALRYTSKSTGALPGEHVVFIATVAEDDGEGRVLAKEILPSRYNSKSTLSVTVDASSRTHDFALQSQ